MSESKTKSQKTVTTKRNQEKVFLSFEEIKAQARKPAVKEVYSEILGSWVHCKSPTAEFSATHMDILRSEDKNLTQILDSFVSLIVNYLCDQDGNPCASKEDIIALGLDYRGVKDLLNELTEGYHKEGDAGNA